MAGRDYEPDEWSDHDFFVVTRPGEQEAFRTGLWWLPRADDVALSFRETAHGVKVVYADGHLLEFAVFDLDELGLAEVNRTRVLLDRGGVEERMEDVVGATESRPPADDAYHFGQLVTNVLVGVGRARRGEELSGAFFVKTQAVRHLAILLARAFPVDRGSLLDALDPLRRFERIYPEFGRELAALQLLETPRAGRSLLDLAERALRPSRPDLAWAAVEAVRARLG